MTTEVDRGPRCLLTPGLRVLDDDEVIDKLHREDRTDFRCRESMYTHVQEGKDRLRRYCRKVNTNNLGLNLWKGDTLN